MLAAGGPWTFRDDRRSKDAIFNGNSFVNIIHTYEVKIRSSKDWKYDVIEFHYRLTRKEVVSWA